MRSLGHWTIVTKQRDIFVTRIAEVSGIHVDKVGTQRGQSDYLYPRIVSDFYSRGKTTTLRTFFTRIFRRVFHRNTQEFTSVFNHILHILHMTNNKYYKINLFINY